MLCGQVALGQAAGHPFAVAQVAARMTITGHGRLPGAKDAVSVQAVPQSALDVERRPGLGTMKQPTLGSMRCNPFHAVPNRRTFLLPPWGRLLAPLFPSSAASRPHQLHVHARCMRDHGAQRWAFGRARAFLATNVDRSGSGCGTGRRGPARRIGPAANQRDADPYRLPM